METEKTPATMVTLQGSGKTQDKYTNYLPDSKNIQTDSFESEKLKKLIDDRKNYLQKLTNDFAKKKTQGEIIFLEKQILPIVQSETVFIFYEVQKYVQLKVSEAVAAGANVLFVAVPLVDPNEDTLIVATANPHRDNPTEGIEVDITAEGRRVEEVRL